MKSISVLTPTRGRPESLLRSIRSLVEKAASPQKIEILLRVDDDDATMQSSRIMTTIAEMVPHGCFTRGGPRGAGYREVYKMYNELAAVSTGAWLINWNDDVEMLTPGWDDLVRHAPPHSIQFFRRDIFDRADTTFPCTGRSVYAAMGHLSLQTHADDWMRVVAEKARCGVPRNDIQFHHHRLNDQTSRDRDAGGYDTDGFRAAATQALIEIDAERVRAARPKESA